MIKAFVHFSLLCYNYECKELSDNGEAHRAMKMNVAYWIVSSIYLLILLSMAKFTSSGSIEAYLIISVTVPFLIILGIIAFIDKKGKTSR